MRTDHVEGDYIFEGYLASLVFLYEHLIDYYRAGAGWKTENEGMFSCWCESFDSICILLTAESRTFW
jgi:hypothetical protein